MTRKARIPALIGMIVGVVIILLAFTYHSDAYSGISADSQTSFGADFYTYSYQATAKAANNVRYVLQAVQDGFFYLLLALGLTDLAYFGCKFAQTFPEKQPEDAQPLFDAAPQEAQE